MRLVSFNRASDGQLVYINPEHVVRVWPDAQGVWLALIDGGDVEVQGDMLTVSQRLESKIP